MDLFSVGFGGYYAHAVGNIKFTESSTNASVQARIPTGTQYAGFETNGISRSDLSLVFAAGTTIPIPIPSLSGYADARFNLGLKNIQMGEATSVNQTTDSVDDNKWRDIQFLVGLQHSL